MKSFPFQIDMQKVRRRLTVKQDFTLEVDFGEALEQLCQLVRKLLLKGIEIAP